MQLDANLPLLSENQLHEVISNAIENSLKKFQSKPPKEWFSLKEAAEYADVSINTLNKFRLSGLKVCEIDGVKRVSKTEIDNFLNSNSY